MVSAVATDLTATREKSEQEIAQLAPETKTLVIATTLAARKEAAERDSVTEKEADDRQRAFESSLMTPVKRITQKSRQREGIPPGCVTFAYITMYTMT